MSTGVDPVEPRPALQEGRELVERDWTEGVSIERGTNLRAAISNAMAGFKKHYYGKGAERVRTYINDQYVTVVLEEITTRNEKTLIARGHQDAVRDYRLRFQHAMRDTLIASIETLTGRKVVAYESQIVFDPDIGFELFVLDGPPDPNAEAIGAGRTGSASVGGR